MIANDFGSLQANRSRRNEFEVANYFRALDEARAQAAQEEAFNQADVRNALTAQQIRNQLAQEAYFRANSEENQRYNRAFRERQFGAERADAAANQAWHLGNLGVNQGKLTQQQLAETLALAEEEAASGLFDPAKYADVLSPVRVQQLASMNLRARKPIQEEYMFFKNAADTKNADEQLGREALSLEEFKKTAPSAPGYLRTALTALSTVVPGLRSFSGSEGPYAETAQAQIDTIAAQKAELRKALEGAALQKNLATGLTKDPRTGEWRPTEALPWEGAFFTPVPDAATTAPAVRRYRYVNGQLVPR